MIPQEYFDKVKKYFGGNTIKTWQWFENIHPKFGMLSPLNMIKLGKENKVIQLIDKEMTL